MCPYLIVWQELKRLVSDPSEDIVYLWKYASYEAVANFMLNQPPGTLYIRGGRERERERK